MKAHIYFVESLVPKEFKRNPEFMCTSVTDPYSLKGLILNDDSQKIIVCRLPFLEIRHYDLYKYLQKTFNNLKTFFIVDELSQAMKTKVKNSDDFIVLWNTEENNLMNDIYKYLDGDLAQLREDKRVPQLSSAMLKPSLMLENMDEMVFKRINGGAFENISTNGSCLNLPNANYKPKDFVSITYQNNEGNYISQEAQIRWIENNPQNEVQRIGLRFLTQG